MLNYHQKIIVTEYLKDTEKVPDMKYMINRDFLENIYNSLDFKLWHFKKQIKYILKSFKIAIMDILQ